MSGSHNPSTVSNTKWSLISVLSLSFSFKEAGITIQQVQYYQHLISLISYIIMPVSAILGSFFSAFFNLSSLCQAFRQGMMKTLTSAMAIPPMEGIAMGLATSAPAPVDQRMGIKPINVVAAVIIQGLILRVPAIRIVSRISWALFIFRLPNKSLIYVVIRIESSSTMPKMEIKPTQTATLKL